MTVHMYYFVSTPHKILEIYTRRHIAWYDTIVVCLHSITYFIIIYLAYIANTIYALGLRHRLLA